MLRQQAAAQAPGPGQVYQRALAMYMEISTAPGFDPWPCCAERGEEPVAWDVDGNRYLDCCMCCAVDCRGI